MRSRRDGFDFWCLRRSRLLRDDNERFAALGDAVDGMQELSHGSDEGELRRLSGGTQAFIEWAQPVVQSDGGEHGHPERASQFGIAESDRGAGPRPFARLSEGGHNTDIGGKGPCGSEARRIAGDGDDARGRIGTDAVDAGQQPPDLVGVEQALDVALDLLQATAPEVDVLADVAACMS